MPDIERINGKMSQSIGAGVPINGKNPTIEEIDEIRDIQRE